MAGTVAGSETLYAGVSVIICCYNSAQRIKPTLLHLSRQNFQFPENAEIILVDNNSSDGTGAVAQEYWRSLNVSFPFRVVNEPQQGLSHARVKGFHEAKWETVVFCDDDNWLSENFLASAVRHFSEHADAAVMGGPIYGEFEAEPQPWFEKYKGFLAIGETSEQGDITALRAFVPGAGMVVRKSRYELIRRNNFRFICSDRKGNKLSSGGDTELCYALVLSGGRIYNFSDLSLKHFVPAGRTSWSYILKLIPAIGAATVILNLYKARINGTAIPKSELRGQLREKLRLVMHPVRRRDARNNMDTGNAIGLGYEYSKAIMRVLFTLVFMPGRLSSINRQLDRLSSLNHSKRKNS
jgi:glycosyltransferase involved in cell wall biosynthesis